MTARPGDSHTHHCNNSVVSVICLVSGVVIILGCGQYGAVWCVVCGDLMKYFPMSGLGCGDAGWLRETLSAVRTVLENEELELSEVWKEREGLWNIREKKLWGAASSSDLNNPESRHHPSLSLLSLYSPSL